MPAHTPGPWKAHNDLTITTHDDVAVIAEVVGPSDAEVSAAQAAADARLIAAAPRMRDELVRVMDTCPPGSAWARETVNRIATVLRDVAGEML